jgi:hypothetical protein
MEMQNVMFVLAKWGMVIEQWGMHQVDNILEKIREVLEYESGGLSGDAAQWTIERTEYALKETIPYIATLSGALLELEAYRAALLKQLEAPAVEEEEPYMSTAELMKDYGLFCGVIMKDYAFEGEAAAEILESMSPHAYLEATVDGRGCSYDAAYDFLREFLWSQWEIENELLDLGIHE